VAQTSGKPNSRAPWWLLPLRRTTVRRNGFLTPRFRQHFYTRLRNGKAFWFNLPLLSYKAFLLSFNFFILFSPPNVPAGLTTLGRCENSLARGNAFTKLTGGQR